MRELLVFLDPVLIAPYRWVDDPVWGWWLGTLVLAGWSVLVGELTLWLAYRVNHRYVRELGQEVTRRQEASFNALKAGDKAAWRSINRLANEAYGKAFFLHLAMGMSSLWPAFLAVAWLEPRFGDLPIPLPGLPWSVGYVAGFIFCYLAVRLAWGRLRRRLPHSAARRELARSLATARQARRRLGRLEGGEAPHPPEG